MISSYISFPFILGRVPKVYLLRPEFVIVITYELLSLMLKKLTGKYPKPPTKEKSS